MRRIFLFTALLACATTSRAAPEPREFPLWPGNPPGMVDGATPGADDGTGRWRNVGIPGLLPYQPDGPAPEASQESNRCR